VVSGFFVPGSARDMENALRVRLPVNEDAPALARQALDALQAELEGLFEQARLLVSELVTNSVRHAGLRPDHRIDLAIEAAPSAVRIVVADPGPGFEPPPQHSPNTEGGFGLFFVEQLADRWGTDENGVWVEFDRPGADEARL
jgi:anti-sigma regulatory factor (Ser/Thr protein kinase)